jgi:uncharacterized membrane protein
LDKARAVWGISFAYLAYLFVGELPQLSSVPYFSEEVAFALLAVVYLVSSFALWGASTAAKFLATTWVLSYVIEFIGTTTGYPFGHYTYTSALGPLLGPVPLFIPFLWCALGYFCLQATGRSVLSSAVLMVVLDLSLDPIFARTLWHWQVTPGPAYFGVPVLNFVGWFITSAIIFTAFRAVDRSEGGWAWRTLVQGCGSRAATVFYLLFGVTTVLFDLSSGESEVAAISLVLYLVAFFAVWQSNSALRHPGYVAQKA